MYLIDRLFSLWYKLFFVREYAMQRNTEFYFTVKFSVRIKPYTIITANLAVDLAVVQFLLNQKYVD